MKIRWLAKRVLFLLNMIIFIFSLGFLGEIGPTGLLCFMLYMISGGYLVLFTYINWEDLKA